MPFIHPEKRKLVDQDVRFADEPGDLCYYFYRKMMNAWEANRRWKTVHQLYKDMVLNIQHINDFESSFTVQDRITALHLAWQIFLVKEVMVYEEEKIEENGDI